MEGADLLPIGTHPQCLGTPSSSTTVCDINLVPAPTHGMYLGNVIPSIAFGTWAIDNGQDTIDQVDQAISVGFSHIGKHFSVGL
jgi:hypothetical protein